MPPSPLLTADLDALLAFAAGSRTDTGFGYLDAAGVVDASQPRQTLITARMTFVFAVASPLGWERAPDLAAHGVTALSGPLADAGHGGWPVSDGPGGEVKTAYVHAFVLLAASASTVAGVPGAVGLLHRALRVWDTRFWDERAGMAVEEYPAAWGEAAGYRGANSNMHGVEAMLAAADALDLVPGAADPELPTPAELRERVRRVLDRVVHRIARPAGWRLPEHYDEHWRPLPDYNRDRPSDPFRPYGVTVGHQFEWARLLLQANAAPGGPEEALADATGLYRAAVERGWAADGHDGFPYTLDFDDRPVVTARMHWVLTEAISAAAVLLALTGDPGRAAELRRWTDHARDVFADGTGSWHHELTPSGAVGTTTWPGKPDAYHLAQALLLPRLPVRSSLPAAVAAHASGRTTP